MSQMIKQTRYEHVWRGDGVSYCHAGLSVNPAVLRLGCSSEPGFHMSSIHHQGQILKKDYNSFWNSSTPHLEEKKKKERQIWIAIRLIQNKKTQEAKRGKSGRVKDLCRRWSRTYWHLKMESIQKIWEILRFELWPYPWNLMGEGEIVLHLLILLKISICTPFIYLRKQQVHEMKQSGERRVLLCWLHVVWILSES